MAKPKLKTFTDAEMNLIARALHEAGDRNINPLGVRGYDFQADDGVGHDMWALLDRAFPDFARSSREIAAVKRAIEAGYMPPPGGITSKSVQEFLFTHDAMNLARQEASRPSVRQRRTEPVNDDTDFPF